MSKKKVELGLTLATPVSDTLKIIEGKLKELKRVQDAVYKCPAQMEGMCNIQTETKVENLIRAFGSIKSREDSYHQGAQDMGLTAYPVFKIQGCNPQDWRDDILLRKDVIEYSEQLEKLNKLKTKAQEFMTKEEQFEIFKRELESI